MTTTSTIAATFFVRQRQHVPPPWWRNWLTYGSILLHGLLLLALWQLSRQPGEIEAPPRTIELVLQAIQPPADPEPVRPQPVSRPLQPAPVRAVPAVSSAPPLRTVADAAERAETRTETPAQPQPETPPAVATPVPEPVAAAAAPTAKVIAMEGIPSDYVNQVFTRINQRVVYPRVARLRGEEGRVAYRLTLSAQGQLIKVEIQSSGSDELDQAASRAIKAAAPFPKLPELGGSTYLLAGTIQFSINASERIYDLTARP